MQLEATQYIFNYWNTIRGVRRTPDRTEMRFLTLGDLMDSTLVLQRGYDGKFFIRAPGAKLNNVLKYNVQGERLSNLFQKEDQDSVDWMLEGVIEDSTPAIAGLSMAPHGAEQTQFEFIALPFSSSDVPTLFCLLQAIGPIPWYDRKVPGPIRLSSFRFLHPNATIEEMAACEPVCLQANLPGLLSGGRRLDAAATVEGQSLEFHWV